MKENNVNSNEVYLIGGRDAEMCRVKKVLDRSSQVYIDKGLGWGAKAEDYKEEICSIIESGKTPIALELSGADKIDGVVDMDHHNEKSDRPAVITQVMNRLGLEMSLFDKLIAANDSAYIPGMEEVMEENRAEIEVKTGPEKFEEIKNKLISFVRLKDRQAQGITKEQEDQAEEAIKNREDFEDGELSVVHLSHSKCATVTDRLFGTYKNLLIISGDGETNFYGDGEVCEKLKEKYNGSWAGGSGFGKSKENAFWGGYVDQKEVEDYLKTNKMVKENIQDEFNQDWIESALMFDPLRKAHCAEIEFDKKNKSFLLKGKDFYTYEAINFVIKPLSNDLVLITNMKTKEVKEIVLTYDKNQHPDQDFIEFLSQGRVDTKSF